MNKNKVEQTLNLPTEQRRSGNLFFTMIASCVVNQLLKKENQKALPTYLRLSAYYSKVSYKKGAYPTQETLAKELGLSERTIVEHIQLLKGVVCSHGDPVLKVTKQWEDNKSKNTYHLLQLKELYKQSEFIGVDKHFLSLLG
tara:strand:- start:502 stop:927 length:426 start_codon:yes stop_codon:yes gene_type:complete